MPHQALCREKGVLLRYLYSIDRFYQEKLGAPMGVFVDRELNELYVADNLKNEILVFDAVGTPVFKLNKKKGIKGPFDLAVSDGFLYISQEGKNYIEVLNFRGEFVSKIAPPADVPFIPGRLDIDEKNFLYVVNKAQTNCIVFNAKGEFINTIGDGLFSLASVAVSKDRVYLITPFDTSAIQVYDKKGKFIMHYEAISGDMGTNLSIPTAAVLDNKGRLWLTDGTKGVVTYDMDGRELSRSSEYGLGKLDVFFPIDIDFNGNNMLFIVNKMRKSVDVFKIDF